MPLLGVSGGFGTFDALLDELASVAAGFLGGGLVTDCFEAGALPDVVGRFEGLDAEGGG